MGDERIGCFLDEQRYAFLLSVSIKKKHMILETIKNDENMMILGTDGRLNQPEILKDFPRQTDHIVLHLAVWV
jgi:hypothetical protein